MARCNRLLVLALLSVPALLCQRTALAAGPSSPSEGLAIAEQEAEDSSGLSLMRLLGATEPQNAKDPSCGGDAACDAACGGCDARCLAWIVEMEGVWLTPTQHQDFGAVSVVNDEWTTTNDESFVLSPRITVGVQGACWGILGRYWRLQNGDVTPEFARVSGDGTQLDNALRAETADLEITRLLVLDEHDAELRLSFGARYAQLKQAAGLSVIDTNAYGYFRGDTFSSCNFSGIGLTAGLTGIRPIGCNGFNLFFNARASILWDDDAANYTATRALYVGPSGAAGDFDNAIASNNSNLFIGEVQVGGQWNLPLQCMPANAFVRAAVEYQYWCTSSNSGTASISGAGLIGGPYVIATGQTQGDKPLDLFGFTLGTGLTW